MKIVSTIYQKSIKKSMKMRSMGVPGATLGVFGIMLVESDEFWPHFGLIFFTFSLPDGSRCLQDGILGRFGLQVKIGPRSDPKRLSIRWSIWRLIFEAIWSEFGSISGSKTSQNGAKLDAKSIQVWCWFESCCWKDFGTVFCSILYTT